MNHHSKAGLDRLLRLAAVVIMITHVSPLQAQEPFTAATPYGPQLKPSDPLTPLNTAFRTAYASLRDQVLAKTSPIIIQSGDRMVLLKDGVRTEAPALSHRYHELKALEGRDFRPEQRERQLRIIDRSLAFIDTTLRTRMVSETALRQFTLSQSEDIQANTYEAAEDQIHTMDKQLQAWLVKMTPEERKRLRVVVGAAHMPRVGNLAMQYFSVRLGEPYEGRYGEEEEKNNDFRLIYSESMFEEQDALRVLATHLLDADIGVYFFNDAQRMHRDLLGDAVEEIIRKKFGKTPAASQ
jgi:hypothetical protein